MFVEILPEENLLEIQLDATSKIDEIVIEDETGASTSLINAQNIETISSKELTRAACCSLAESFETNGGVNVNTTDAVTGSKEIEMLGLRGIYTQMLIEKRPAMYGLCMAHGLEYYPGT